MAKKAPAKKAPAKKEKVCIVGCSNTKDLAPYHRTDEFEFWGVNNLFLTLPDMPWTRWWEIHLIENEGGKWLRRKEPEFRGQKVEEYLKALAKLPCPVYMQTTNPLVPNAIEYPLAAVLNDCGNYFTNTISYQIALAILEKFKEIHVYGVDMAVDTEYAWQRPSCEYLLGVAAGRGIEICMPDACDLLKTRFLYGFQEQQSLPWEEKTKNTRKTIAKKKSAAIQQMQFAQKQIDQYTGAELTLDEMLKAWKNVTGG
jgi:hypothetical protein